MDRKVQKECIIAVDGLEFAYNDNKTIFEDVSFQLHSGECLGLLGSNGSGKTTLINCMLGEYQCRKGTITVLGTAYNGDDLQIKKKIAVVPDDQNVMGYLTLQEYLKFVWNSYGLPKEKMDASIDKLCEMFRMADCKHKVLGIFSHGMKKKAQMIAALMCQPRVLIVDEPTNGLDIETICELKEIIGELKKKGTAIMISTHILEFAEKVCSDIIILHNHRITPKYQVDELEGSLEETFMRCISENQKSVSRMV